MAPDVSVVIPTHGRPTHLVRALESVLASATDRRVEVIVVDDNAPGSEDRERTWAALRPFASRADVRCVQHLHSRHGGAARNTGAACSEARWLAFLDDDDIVTANWIEEFRAAHETGPGTILRAQCAVQEHRRTSDARIDYEPTGGFDAPFNREFDMVQHRQLNQTPICSWAIPMGAARALRLRFDEELAVCEDWEFLVRAAEFLGVSNRPEFTSVYRRFTDGWGSMTTIEQEVWDDTALLIRYRLDARPSLLPAGSLEPLAKSREEAAAYAAAYDAAIAQVEAFERSRYWRLTAPLRWVTSRRGDTISLVKARLRGLHRSIVDEHQ